METLNLKNMHDVEARLKSLHARYDGTNTPEAELLTIFDDLPRQIKQYAAQKRIYEQQLKLVEDTRLVLSSVRKDILSMVDRFVQIPS